MKSKKVSLTEDQKKKLVFETSFKILNENRFAGFQYPFSSHDLDVVDRRGRHVMKATDETVAESIAETINEFFMSQVEESYSSSWPQFNESNSLSTGQPVDIEQLRKLRLIKRLLRLDQSLDLSYLELANVDELDKMLKAKETKEVKETKHNFSRNIYFQVDSDKLPLAQAVARSKINFHPTKKQGVWKFSIMKNQSPSNVGQIISRLEQMFGVSVDIDKVGITEISKKKLANYAKAAHADIVSRTSSDSFTSGAAGDAYNKADPSHKELRRQQGLSRALDKLSKQDIGEEKTKCPPATQDITLNLKNRQKAIDDYGYGPLNPDLPNSTFWLKKVQEWNLDSVQEAKRSLCGNCAAFDIRQDTLDCIAKGIGDDLKAAEGVIDAGDLGYCRFLKFKCASKRTCDAWVTGGPLVDKTVKKAKINEISPWEYDSDLDYYDALARRKLPKGPRPGDEDYELYAPADPIHQDDDDEEFKQGVAEGTESQYIAARYIDEFGDGDHWYVKGTPDVIKKFVLLANSLEDETVKGTEYEPGKGMMGGIHAELGNDAAPQWTVVPARNLEAIKPIGDKVLQRLMRPNLADGVQEFMSELLWAMEAKGLALVTDDSQQGVAEGYSDYKDSYEDEQELYSGCYVRDRQEGPGGEVFVMRGDPEDRRVRIEDRDGRGWYISPYRLELVDENDPAIKQYFGGISEAKSLKKRVRVVQGEHAGKTGWIREIKHGIHSTAPKRYYVDIDGGGQANNLPASALRLLKNQSDSQTGMAEATGDTKFDAMMGNIKKSAPVPVSGYVAVEYASENKSDRIKGVTLKGKPMPTSIDPDDLDGEIEFGPDEIERHLIKIGRDNGWSIIDPGHGRGYSELFFDTNANYTSDTQSILAKNIVNTVTQINKFFSGLNSSLQSTGLPGYKVAVWQEISSPNGQKIGDINQIKQIALTKVVRSPNDPGELIGQAILRELPAVEQDEYDDFTPEDFAYARKIAKIYITKGERAGLKAQISNRRMDHVSDLIDELLSLSGAQKYRTLKLDDLDEQHVGRDISLKESLDREINQNLEENLHKWFKEKWVRFGPDGKIRGDCARGNDSEGKPKCLPQAKAHSLGRKGRASAAARKRREDPNPERSGKAINVATKKKVNEQAIVSRIDSKKIGDFSGSLKSYKHTHDWSQSGLDTGDDSYWNKQSIKPLTSSGLFAGDEKRIALYATGNAHQTRFVEFILNGKPIVYFDTKDWPRLSKRKTYLTQFDAKNFKKLPTGEYFSDNPGTPIKQTLINDPEQFIKSKGWTIKFTDDLNKILDYVKKLEAKGVIKHYGAEGMNKLEEKWSAKYKRSIDCNNPKGFSQRAHCQGRKKNEAEQLDEKCWDTHKQVGMKSKGGKMVPDCVPKESVEDNQSCPECGGPMFSELMINEKKDACYYKVKSRYKVWPSAYASGALVKCRKRGAKNWGSSK